MSGLLAVCALILLQLAACRSLGMLEPVSLALVLTALALVLAASALPWSPRWEARGERLLPRTLIVLVGSEVVLLLVIPPAVRLPATTSLLTFRLIAAGLALVVLSYAFKPRAKLRWRFPAVVVLYGLLGAWVLCALPIPVLDVLAFQERASDLLLHGHDPYDAEYPNVYGDTAFYGPGVVRDGQVYSFPYPPLSLLLALPGHLAGDVRWSLLAALLASAAFLAAAGRSLAAAEDRQAELAAIAFLCHPRGLVVLQLGWTEPFLMAAVSFCAWAIASRRKALTGVGVALVLAAKQYAVLWVVALWACRCIRWREVLAGGVLAFLLAVPFILWNPVAFWQGVVQFQLEQPFRTDALSVLAAVWVATGLQLPAVIGFAVAAAVIWLVARRAPPHLAGAALGGSAIFLAFFAFNKQAFLNYYWFAASLLALALATLPSNHASRPHAPAPF
jgi:hypothetical protein